MRNITRIGFEIIIVFLSMWVPLKLYLWIYSNYWAGTEWILIILAILHGLFSAELWNSLQGNKIDWYDYERSDKIVFFIAVSISLLLIGYAIKANLPQILQFGLILLGGFLPWVIVRSFGSPNMRLRSFNRRGKITEPL